MGLDKSNHDSHDHNYSIQPARLNAQQSVRRTTLPASACAAHRARGLDVWTFRRLDVWAALLLMTCGCFGPANLPTETEVVLPGDARQTATVNSGAESLASSTWEARRAADPDDADGDSDDTPRSPYGGLLNGGFLDRVPVDALMFRVEFNENGVATRITNNRFYLPDMFGDQLISDGQFHGTRTPGLTYAAASFAVQQDNQIGLAFPAEVRFLGLPLGMAVVYGWGTFNEDETRLDGTFGYSADLNLIPELLLGSGADQYPFYVNRLP